MSSLTVCDEYTAFTRTIEYTARRRCNMSARREKYQFEESEILIQPYADGAGPFEFDLGPQLPSGDEIASFSIKSFLNDTDTSDDLITASDQGAGDDINKIKVWFKYPGASLKGSHKLTFQYTTGEGMKDEADFFCVLVSDI